MKLAAFFAIALLSSSGISIAASQNLTGNYEAGFVKRAEFFLSVYDTLKSPDYYACAVKYARRADIETADKNALLLLKHPTGDMFWMIAVMNMYLHGKDVMSHEVGDAVRNAWKTYMPYRGDTENHWVQYHSTFFLATEQWPGLPGSEWFNGRSSKDNEREEKGYLLSWMKTTTTIGSGEFDSPDYFPEYINPMLLLAEYAKDPQIRQMGKMMVDYFLAEFAAENLQGQYVGGYSRIYEPAVYEPSHANVNAYAYLYFDEGEPIRSGWVTIAALSTYRLPKIIYDISHERNKPYIHTEIKRVRNIIRYGPVRNPRVFKYDYITKDYALGSLQGGILQPIQQHTWALFYTHGKPYTTMFSIHPYWAGFELASFFPEERETMIASVASSKGTYNNPDKWTGSSPFERTFQYKNTLLVLYNIKPGTHTEHIDGFFPKTLDTLVTDPTGWIISKAGDVYVGWYPLQRYEWIDEGAYTRLRSHELQNGLVLEVRSMSEIGSIGNFLNQLRNRKPKSILQPRSVSVSYTTLEGVKLNFVFPNVREINGRKVDLMSYEYYNGPFLHSNLNSGLEHLTCGKESMTLDFRNLKVAGDEN